MLQSLYILSLDRLVKQLTSIRTHKLRIYDQTVDSQVLECYNYLKDGGLLVYEIAKRCQYFQSDILSIIFLPFLFQSGDLIISEYNADAIMQYLELSSLFNESCPRNLKRISVRSWSSGFTHESLELKRNFFTKLINLKVISFDSDVNDNIIQIIVDNCPLLQVLDCSQSSISLLNNRVFESLSKLCNLRYILFSMLPNEFDISKEDIRISEEVIASVVTSLPFLKQIQCPEFKLRATFKILHEKEIMLPTVKILNLEGAGSRADAFKVASSVCPNLEEIYLMINKLEEKDIAESLCRFPQLKKVTLNSLCASLSSMQSFWTSRLTFLDIKAHVFVMKDFILLGTCCTNLETLCVFDQCKYNASLTCVQVDTDIAANSFPSLVTFVYRLRDLNGLGYLLPMLKKVKNLYAKCDTLPVSYELFVKQLIPDTILPNVEKIVIPQMILTKSLATDLISFLPLLSYLNVQCEDDPSTIDFNGEIRYMIFNFDLFEIFPPKTTLTFDYDIE